MEVTLTARRGTGGVVYFHGNPLREGRNISLNIESLLVDGTVVSIDSGIDNVSRVNFNADACNMMRCGAVTVVPESDDSDMSKG
jgi:hypothetical protein